MSLRPTEQWAGELLELNGLSFGLQVDVAWKSMRDQYVWIWSIVTSCFPKPERWILALTRSCHFQNGTLKMLTSPNGSCSSRIEFRYRVNLSLSQPVMSLAPKIEAQWDGKPICQQPAVVLANATLYVPCFGGFGWFGFSVQVLSGKHATELYGSCHVLSPSWVLRMDLAPKKRERFSLVVQQFIWFTRCHHSGIISWKVKALNATCHW